MLEGCDASLAAEGQWPLCQETPELGDSPLVKGRAEPVHKSHLAS